MCGIVGLLGGRQEAVERVLGTLKHRGPDARGVIEVGDVTLGHTRLAILDLDPRSDQPFRYGDVTLSFNGEVWNYLEVRAELEGLGRAFTTDGDTEVVAAALDEWEPVRALGRLNGMFALAWTEDGGTLNLSRDRYGEMPLHFGRLYPLPFASEKKTLLAMNTPPASIEDVLPGEIVTVSREGIARRPYYDAPNAPKGFTPEAGSEALRSALMLGAKERAISDVPVCTLLSGGIDSAAVAAYLKDHVPNLVAYTAVFDSGSRDHRMAIKTADHLGIELREVHVPMPAPEDLSRVVETIEMPFKAQVEIGWACLVMAERIAQDGFKVVFSGEGSDELFASYGFAYHGLKKQGWHEYRKGLFLDQARKNFARCNKVFMSHSVECRLPFLHPPLVELALSLKQEVVQDGKSKPKAVLQRAVENDLPEEVVHRPKVAFQDGLGLKEAIAGKLGDPKRFYRAEYKRIFERRAA